MPVQYPMIHIGVLLLSFQVFGSVVAEEESVSPTVSLITDQPSEVPQEERGLDILSDAVPSIPSTTTDEKLAEEGLIEGNNLDESQLAATELPLPTIDSTPPDPLETDASSSAISENTVSIIPAEVLARDILEANINLNAISAEPTLGVVGEDQGENMSSLRGSKQTTPSASPLTESPSNDAGKVAGIEHRGLQHEPGRVFIFFVLNALLTWFFYVKATEEGERVERAKYRKLHSIVHGRREKVKPQKVGKGAEMV